MPPEVIFNNSFNIIFILSAISNNIKTDSSIKDNRLDIIIKVKKKMLTDGCIRLQCAMYNLLKLSEAFRNREHMENDSNDQPRNDCDNRSY